VTNFFDTRKAKKLAKYNKDDQVDVVPNPLLDNKRDRGYYNDNQRQYDLAKNLTRTEQAKLAWEDFNSNPLIRGALQQQGFNVTLKNDEGNLIAISIKIDGKDLGEDFLEGFLKNTYIYKFIDCEVTNAIVDGTRFFEFIRDKKTKELIDIVYWQGVNDGKVINEFYPYTNSSSFRKRHALYWVQSDLINGEIIRVLSDDLVGRITPYSKGGIIGDTMLEPLHMGSLNQRKALNDMLAMRDRMKPKLGITVLPGQGQNSFAEVARTIDEDLEDRPDKYAVISTGDVHGINHDIRGMTDMEHNRWLDTHVLSCLQVPEGNISGFAKNVNRAVLEQQSKNQYDGIISSIRDRIDAELIHKAIKAWLLYNKDYPPSMIKDAVIKTKWTDKVLQYMEYDLEVEKVELEKQKFEYEKSKGE